MLVLELGAHLWGVFNDAPAAGAGGSGGDSGKEEPLKILRGREAFFVFLV